MSTAHATITKEQFEAMPNQDRYELVDGRLVKRQMSNISSHFHNVIYALLLNYSVQTKSGKAFGDNTNYSCFVDDPELVRKPDASWFSKNRAPKALTREAYTVAPDLIVEAISPRESAEKTEKKIQQFFDAGTKEAWIVYPEINVLYRHFASGEGGRRYGLNDVIDGAPMLPGFSFKLADILAAGP